ncbi:complement component receptor 1-like protein [Protopterus annectens]|uniref:complement component receptor 1-like protein n=1 Tax=Protopterus annectens TaxID=7888 RepID=UPI001CF9C628|nr:complement component receptor 1-like protein [Protopterus annectens]
MQTIERLDSKVTVFNVLKKELQVLGYFTVGRHQRVCLPNGWDHQNPDCEPIVCDTPPEIVDGLVDLGSFSRYITVGTVATYRCNKFQLIGNATIYCTKSGTWSSSPPICKDVKCPDPEVANGYKTNNFGPIYRYLHSTTFECKLGYWMNGSSRIVCKEDNTWHPSPPTCALFSFDKSCGPLPDIPHGIIEYSDGVDFGSVAQISCEEGYKLVGKNLRVCLFDGWSHQNPVCERFCGDPPTSQKAVLDSNLNVFPVNTTLTYSCRPGYIWDRSSSNKVICQEDSTWTELRITCTLIYLAKSCGPLPDMPHGIIEYSDGVYFGSVAQMSCEEGYKLVGRNLRVCLFDGWSHQNPICIK